MSKRYISLLVRGQIKTLTCVLLAVLLLDTGCRPRSTGTPVPVTDVPATNVAPAPVPANEQSQPEPAPTAAEIHLDWQWVTPMPQGNRLRGLAVGDGMTVAVGDLGAIQYSSDLQNWQWLRVGNEDLNAVAYGHGRFVAVGANGTLLTSGDGVNWERPDVRVIDNLYDVIFEPGNAMFMAVGSDSCILTSPDGLSWSAQSAPSKQALFAVAYGGGVFLAAGEGQQVLTSSDGTAWGSQPLPKVPSVAVPVIGRIEYGNGRFVGIGPMAFFSSPDGKAWTVTPEGTGTMDTLAFGSGQFVALGHHQVRPGKQVRTSTDGITWKEKDHDTDLLRPDWFTFTGGRWFGVGDGGAVLTSQDGSRWKRISRDPGETPMLLAPNGLLAVNPGKVLTAGGSSGWQVHPLAPEFWPDGLAVGSDRFLVTGSMGECDCPVAYVSSKGSVWTKYEPPFHGSAGGPTFGNGLFLVPAADGVWSSPDGKEWTRHRLEPDALVWRVAATGDLFLAGDDKGGLFTSTDGANWALRYRNPEGHPFNAFVYGNGKSKYVAMNSDEVVTSTDGVNWTSHPLAHSADLIRSVAFGNGLFLAVGDEGTMLGSYDGEHWTKLPPVTRAVLDSVIYHDGQFVVTGSPGIVLTARF